MNVKPLAYHWTCSGRVGSILRDGLLPARGVEFTGVYLALDPRRYAGAYDGSLDACFGVMLRGLESKCTLYADRKWVIVDGAVPPSNVLLVTDGYDPEAFETALAQVKERFVLDPRSRYPIRTDRMHVHRAARPERL